MRPKLINKPLISIIIPTYNSGSTLELVLKAIKRQSYPYSRIEILVIDGGSTDKTLRIAKKYKCKILQNPKTLQMYAMQIGRQNAKGKYIVHLDSDEVLMNIYSLENKVKLFSKNIYVKAVIPSGLKTPIGAPSANYFINEFGEPFSYFMYRISINHKFFINMLKKISGNVYEDSDGVILDFSENNILPPIELAAIGIMIEKKFVMDKLPFLAKDPKMLPLSFFYFVKEKALIGFTKNDPILHYSVAEWSKYLKKIKTRIVNNVYGLEMSKAGFTGRSLHYPFWFSLKKYLFIPYTLTVILPIFDAVILAVTRRNVVFLVYPILCIYISLLILYYKFLQTFGIKVVQKGYGI